MIVRDVTKPGARVLGGISPGAIVRTPPYTLPPSLSSAFSSLDSSLLPFPSLPREHQLVHLGVSGA